jgi:uncharacterized membrane protein
MLPLRILEKEGTLTRLVPILLTLAYPVLVYFALHVVSPRALGLGILALFALRLAVVAPRRLVVYARLAGPVAAAVVAASVASLVWNDPRALLLSPALVNVALLLAFALSFAARETLIETLALAQVGTLSVEEHAYCRKLTALWCAFFLANAAVTAELALDGTLESWALYTGLIAYVLMGLLFAVEFVYRHWRFRRYVGLPTDALLRRLFPPDRLP